MRERKGKSLRVEVSLAFRGIFKLNCQFDLGEGEKIYHVATQGALLLPFSFCLEN